MSSCTSPWAVNLMALLEQVEQHLAQVAAVEHHPPRRVEARWSCQEQALAPRRLGHHVA